MRIEELKDIVLHYNTKNEEYKRLEKELTDMKSKINRKLSSYFREQKIEDKKLNFDYDYPTIKGNITVTQIERTDIDFDFDKLEKNLGKEISKKVINKEYTIIDIDSLTTYLKSCNVNPKKFKSYLLINKKINKEELNNLYNLGMITEKQIEETYEIKQYSPYFKLKTEIRQEDE